MERGDVSAACRRFEESERLDPLPGTQLNMAVCHEKEGRTATAWVEFRDAEALARRDGRDDRVALAAEREKALEPRLVRLRVVVPPAADAPRLALTLDGTELARLAWDTPLPVDPGDHVLAASAPDKVARTVHVALTEEGTTKVVVLDKLDDAPSAPLPVVESRAVPAPSAPGPVLPPPRPVEPPGVAPSGGGLGARRTGAIVLGGAAIAGLAAGTFFGLDAFSKHGASNDDCPTPTTCTPRGVIENDDAKTSADRSTVAFGVSLVALGTAAYLWFSGGSTAVTSSTLRVAPIAARGGGGFVVGGAF